MSIVRVSGYTISLDGFGAGPDQSLEAPLGVGGEALHPWLVTSRTFARLYGEDKDAGETGIDDDLAGQGLAGVGAWIMGRNMFAHSRGPWTDDGWRGWWGPNPPYHVPVYVLTHHARPPLEMEGGTVFHFVTDGIHSALEQARASAGTKDIRIGGGASTIRQYLQASLIDAMHVPVTPIVLGRGEPLFSGLDLDALGYSVSKSVAGAKAIHYFIGRK